jgi:hypothetical protein
MVGEARKECEDGILSKHPRLYVAGEQVKQ